MVKDGQRWPKLIKDGQRWPKVIKMAKDGQGDEDDQDDKKMAAR